MSSLFKRLFVSLGLLLLVAPSFSQSTPIQLSKLAGTTLSVINEGYLVSTGFWGIVFTSNVSINNHGLYNADSATRKHVGVYRHGSVTISLGFYQESTVDYESKSAYTVTLFANDSNNPGYLSFVTATFTIGNLAGPTLVATGITVDANVTSTLTFNITNLVRDHDNLDLQIESIENKPSWVNYANNAFVITPRGNDSTLTLHPFSFAAYSSASTLKISTTLNVSLLVNQRPTLKTETGASRTLKETPYTQRTALGFSLAYTDKESRRASSIRFSDPDFERLGRQIMITSTTRIFDFEADPNSSTYTVTVWAYDNFGAESLPLDLILTINDDNELPTFSVTGRQNTINEITSTLTVASQIDTGYDFTASDVDADDDTLEITILNNTSTYTLFTISNNNLVIVQSATLDYDLTPTITASIRITEGRSSTPQTITAFITITLSNINEPPVLVTTGNIIKAINRGTLSLALSTFVTDQEGDAINVSNLSAPTWVSYNANNSVFLFTPNDQANLTSQFHNVSFEARSAGTTEVVNPRFRVSIIGHTQLITCTGGCLGVRTGPLQMQSVINEEMHDALKSGNDFYTGVQLSVKLNLRNSPGVGSVNFHLAGPDKDFFVLPTRSGYALNVTMKAGINYNFEDKSLYTISMVAIQDGGQVGATHATLTITDVNETPSISISGSQVKIEDGTYDSDHFTGISISIIDPDTKPTFVTNALSILVQDSLDKANFFTVDSNNRLMLKSGLTLHYVIYPSITLSIAATDGNMRSNTVTLTMNLSKRNNPPEVNVVGPQNQINEGTYTVATKTGLSLRVVDNDGDTITYVPFVDDIFSLDTSDDNAIVIKANSSFDFETKSSYTINITVRDGVTSPVVQAITISISDVNEPPEISQGGSLLRLVEGRFTQATDTGFTFTATDPERTATPVLSVTPTTRFTIASNGNLQIRNNAFFDYNTVADRSITLTVSATDGTSASTHTVVVNIRKDNIFPVITRTGSQVVLNEGGYARNTNTGYSYSAIDAENHTISFSVSDPTRFGIASTGGALFVKANVSIDFEATPTALVTVYANDGFDAVANVVMIRFGNVDEGPVIMQSGTANLSESASTGYSSLTDTGIDIVATDQDQGDSPTLSVADNRFTLINNDLQVKRGVTLDFENEEDRTIGVLITASSNGKTSSHIATVEISNVVEAVVLKTSPVATTNVDNTRPMSITLANYLIIDSAGTATYQLMGAIPANWNNVAINNGVLVGNTDISNLGLQSFTIQVRQTAPGGHTSPLQLVLPLLLIRGNFDDISQEIIPNVFDALVAQSSGAVVSRIAKLNLDEVITPYNREVVAALRSNVEMLESGKINIYELFQDRELALGFHDGEYGSRDLGLWARFGFNSLEAEQNNVSYNGNIYGVSSGVDYRFVDGGVLGVAFSNNNGEIDFTQTQNNSSLSGVYDINLNTVQPYFSNTFIIMDYWFSLGYGDGEVEIVDASKTSIETNDLRLMSFGFGFDTNIENQLSLLETDTGKIPGSLDIFMEVNMSKLSVEKNKFGETDDEYDKLSWKSGLLYSNNISMQNNSNMITELGVAVINRQTSSEVVDTDSWGYELFSSFEYLTHTTPLRITGDLSYLAVDDLKQISAGLAAIYRQSSSRLGSFFELAPAYRSKGSIDIYDLATNNKEDINNAQILLNSEIGYGFGVIGGVFTPYGDYTIEHDKANYGLGVRFEQANKLTWSLGVNTEDNKAQETKFGIEYKVVN